ncbi:MAG: NADAR family protein [Patescibacteria group bacterium]
MEKNSRYADNENRVGFYPREFYVFCNFSSFAVEWKGVLYMTSEHAYHSEKFEDEEMKKMIRNTRSAHDALQFAKANKDRWRKDWHDVKVGIMEQIVRVKLSQHPYIMKKLKESGNKEIVEDSWRDDFWGWGENHDGQNMMGKIWMKIRKEIYE